MYSVQLKRAKMHV